MSSYDGFRNEQTGGMIMVTRIDRPYEDVRAAMEANLAADGVTPDYAEDLAQGDLPGRLVLVSQARGGEFTSSWQRLLGSGEETIVISGICSQAPCDEQLEQLEAALRSAVWDSDAPQQLGVHLVDTGGLQAIMEDERELMYSSDGTLAGDVVFHVSLVPGSISDEQRQRALDRFEALHGFEAQDVKPVTIDGLEGRVSVGASKAAANGKLFYDVVLFDREGIWYLSGNARKDSPATREVFERMASSFARGSAARFSGG
ncbi:hypothetical protein DB30_04259 [Enhygromyxa salina]|uniref:Uncharacterized protein n=1 Tax=Enhygromyxa salina TaxID=215803 RepID=A0A0C2D4M9_9BACT|nr:hypothetical protein [Enhygromyxa salina]KIG16640.1 hypothetical protein DB30_04259 [Enhygromyxa salina]